MASTEKPVEPKEIAESFVNQLQREANLDRMKTSDVIASLMEYVEENQDKDLLVTGFNDPSMKNPYKWERLNKCSII